MHINAFSSLHKHDNHVHVAFSSPQRVLSSAVLNGGLTSAQHILNMKVARTGSADEAPDKRLLCYAKEQGWSGKVVGMMTAASMSSFRIERTCIEGVDLAVLVTTGLGNARRAGDRADVQELSVATTEVGTINLILICSARISDAAMVEAVMMATEAKAVAMQNMGIVSPVSNEIATGTGTDAVAVVSGNGPQEIAFCGKHVLLGECIGRLVIMAIEKSLQD